MRATSSLPVPVSPSTSTVACDGATRARVFITSMIAGLWPTSAGPAGGLSRRLPGSVAAVPPHAGQPPAPERARQRLAQRGQVVRLADEVVRAGADGLARRGRVAERGEHQHQRAGIPLAEHPQQVEPALLGHAEIGQDGVERARFLHLGERLVGREGRDDVVGLPLQHLRQQAAGLLVVVHQQQPGVAGG